MTAVRIRKKLDSDTLHLPELKPLIGRMVEITVEEQIPAIRDEFYAELGRLPDTVEAYEAQRTVFRQWRSDPRFEVYWNVLDHALERSFEQVLKWIAAEEAVRNLKDYDFDAWREQRDYDLQHADDHMP